MLSPRQRCSPGFFVPNHTGVLHLVLRCPESGEKVPCELERMSLQSPAQPVCAWREAFAAAQSDAAAGFQLSCGLVQCPAARKVCLPPSPQPWEQEHALELLCCSSRAALCLVKRYFGELCSSNAFSLQRGVQHCSH